MLHGNCIAWFDTASNDFNISSAGWETVTTKSRLNAILEEFASGCRVIQKDFQWFLSDFGTLKPFVDGMKVKWVYEVVLTNILNGSYINEPTTAHKI